MATALGKFLRVLRMDRDELMKDMASKLHLASSTLSSIENGRRNPPKDFATQVKTIYKLTDEQSSQLDDAIMQSKEEVSFRIRDMSDSDQKLAITFARRFENLSQGDKDRIKEILSTDDQN